MAGDPYKKVRPGERLKIPAAAYNGFVDAAKMARRMDGAAGVPHWRHGVLVTVQNISEEDQDRFAVMGIDGPLFTPAENLHEFCDYVGFKVTTPAGEHLKRFVVLAEPIAAGGIGAATVYGTTQAKVDIATEGQEDDRFAGACPGRTDVLVPMSDNASGMILWKESGLGEKWAIIRISNPYNDLY